MKKKSYYVIAPDMMGVSLIKKKKTLGQIRAFFPTSSGDQHTRSNFGRQKGQFIIYHGTKAID